MEKEVEAVVQKIVDGRHGPYAVASCDGIKGSVTFALTKEVWHEDDDPHEGEYVILSRLRKKRAGWRAMAAHFVRP